MKELQSGHRQRLKERFAKSKNFDLPDYEILEMLLYLVLPRKDTKPIAKLLLQRFNSLIGVINADMAQLSQIDYVGPSVVHLFKLLDELLARFSREKLWNKSVISNWGELINYCKMRFGSKPVEIFGVIYLNSKSEIIEEDSQIGTLNRVAIYPREIIKKALMLNSASVLMVHNHPSGLARPSEADISVTMEIEEGLRYVEIDLLDHIIVSGLNHFCFKNSGLI
jgi:DNA repair protein RadC